MQSVQKKKFVKEFRLDWKSKKVIKAVCKKCWNNRFRESNCRRKPLKGNAIRGRPCTRRILDNGQFKYRCANVRKLNYRSIFVEIKDLNMDYIVIVESVEARSIRSGDKKRRAEALLKSIN